MNRVEKFKLNAKKAYDFARGALVVKNGDKLVYCYQRIPGKGYLFKNYNPEQHKRKLTSQEQKVFISNLIYAYKYAWKLKERLAPEVEDVFLNTLTEENLPYVLNYCKIFKLPVPENFHNFAIMTAAIEMPGAVSKKRSKRSKRYLSNLDKNKKIAKDAIDLFIANGFAKEEDSLKDLLERLSK